MQGHDHHHHRLRLSGGLRLGACREVTRPQGAAPWSAPAPFGRACVRPAPRPAAGGYGGGQARRGGAFVPGLVAGSARSQLSACGAPARKSPGSQPARPRAARPVQGGSDVCASALEHTGTAFPAIRVPPHGNPFLHWVDGLHCSGTPSFPGSPDDQKPRGRLETDLRGGRGSVMIDR